MPYQESPGSGSVLIRDANHNRHDILLHPTADAARLVRDYWGAAERLAALQPGGVRGKAIDWFRQYLCVNVDDNEQIVWRSAQNAPDYIPREAFRASLELRVVARIPYR